MPALARSAADPATRRLAERAKKAYHYPVDSQLYTPDGEPLAHVPANELGGAAVKRYHELLDAGRHN